MGELVLRVLHRNNRSFRELALRLTKRCSTLDTHVYHRIIDYETVG